ncbi:YheC/YheD family protein [Paenibacillus sp. LHD-38]|uniref:YheC/YheD family protein n=1 Tax=Paenibacillus sp. LHD-38 TaxID=3072143 RepID=UPI00280C847A|nr:YheC/YheD family protein [Paenibacillus sp. LHD-38]MDQ8739113.1 YheC/YheD family protein [Paenibacillus sp. LHD-38]
MNARPQNKWVKFKVLKDTKKFDRYLPETQRFSRKSLWDFMRKYGTVMLKPYLGKSGYGIIQVSPLEENRYVIQNENRKIILDGKRAFLGQLKKMTRHSKYIVQRRICLAEIDKRPFDIKVLVQRKKQLSWKVSGMLAVVAERDYVVTNVSRTILPIKKAIAQTLLKPTPTKKLLKSIIKVCLLAAKQLSDYYPSQNIISFDIGLDHNAKVWIIEANFKPSKKPFLILKKGK